MLKVIKARLLANLNFMIEVEKKFFLKDGDIEALKEGGELLGTKIFTDVYYDNKSFDLTRNDTWLRSRDGRWELKIPLEHFQTRVADQYRELETEKEIAEELKLPTDQPFMDALKNAGYESFASLTITRTKYKKDDFIIDVDSIDFGYELAEIEKMVNDTSEIEKATKDILDFADKYKLQVGQVRGKVIEYLRRYKREHFDSLVEAGVVLPDGSR